MIRVVFPSFQIHCDTPDEVFAVTSRLIPNHSSTQNGNVENVRELSGTAAGTRWTGSRFQNFWGRLNDKEKRVLTELHTNSDGVTATAIRQTLGLSSGLALGAILAGMSRKAKLVGITFEDVIHSEAVSLSNGEKFREFRIVPSFASVALEAGVLKAVNQVA